jgi:hypothetical protein
MGDNNTKLRKRSAFWETTPVRVPSQLSEYIAIVRRVCFQVMKVNDFPEFKGRNH